MISSNKKRKIEDSGKEAKISQSKIYYTIILDILPGIIKIPDIKLNLKNILKEELTILTSGRNLKKKSKKAPSNLHESSETDQITKSHNI